MRRVSEGYPLRRKRPMRGDWCGLPMAIHGDSGRENVTVEMKVKGWDTGCD